MIRRSGRSRSWSTVLGSVLAAGVLLLGYAPNANAGSTTGLAVTKTCPNDANQGDTVKCTIKIQNLDPDHGVSDLAVTNQVPFPGGSIVSVSGCDSSLSKNGTTGDTTSCDVNETLDQSCSGESKTTVDRVMVTAKDNGLTVEGSVTNGITVFCSTPTPTFTPTDTGTPTLSPTLAPPTATPTITNTPTVTATATNTQPVHVTGLSVSKTCPSSAAQGDTVHCTIDITNLGQSGVYSLSVTNQVPFPGGPTRSVDGCATRLAAHGQSGDSTSCSVTEVLTEPCPPGGTIEIQDRVMADALDNDIPDLTVEGSVTNAIRVTCKAGTPAMSWPNLGLAMVLLAAAGVWLQYRARAGKD